MSVSLDVIRAVYFAAGLQLFGLLNFSLLFPTAPRRWALVVAVLALIAMTAWLALEIGDMSGDTIAAALSDGTLDTVLARTRFGHLWIARAALLAGIYVALAWRGRFARIGATLAAGSALALTAASGHGGTGGLFQLAADMLHLLAAGAWLGGLLPFAWVMATRPAEQAHADSMRFSLMGAVCVGIIFATGSVNGWFLVGNAKALIGTDYGRLLLVKIALFAAMVAIAAINRFQLTPLIQNNPATAPRSLRRNALIEAAFGLAVVGIVAVLGTLPPGYYAAE
jgi:copper resistance protein D